MIEKILMAKEGSYQGEGQVMDGLKKIYFVYGPNGSGKTTISRVLANQTNLGEPETESVMDGSAASVEAAVDLIGANCAVNWQQNQPSEILVYNRDFIAKHFSTGAEVRGIYTFGDNVNVSEEIEEKASYVKKLTDEISGLKKK